MPELSLQSTFWSCPPARDPYSSANLHSLHLQREFHIKTLQLQNQIVHIRNYAYVCHKIRPRKTMHNSSDSPSTYSMTMQRCRLVSKEQNMLTTKGFSANVRMSRSTNTCWIWFLRIKFCRLIFFMANLCRVPRCLTRYTALRVNAQIRIKADWYS